MIRSRLYLRNVVERSNCDRNLSEGYGEIWQRVSFVAIHQKTTIFVDFRAGKIDDRLEHLHRSADAADADVDVGDGWALAANRSALQIDGDRSDANHPGVDTKSRNEAPVRLAVIVVKVAKSNRGTLLIRTVGLAKTQASSCITPLKYSARTAIRLQNNNGAFKISIELRRFPGTPEVYILSFSSIYSFFDVGFTLSAGLVVRGRVGSIIHPYAYPSIQTVMTF